MFITGIISFLTGVYIMAYIAKGKWSIYFKIAFVYIIGLILGILI